MKNLLVSSLAFISMLTSVLYGREHDFLCQISPHIKAVYTIEALGNKDGISRNKIDELKKNYSTAQNKSLKENSFKIEKEGNRYVVFKGDRCLFSGLHNLNSFMCNSDTACFLAAGSDKIIYGAHRVDLGTSISDFEQLKMYIHREDHSQEISFPQNFYPSQLFLSSKGRNLFIRGTIIKATDEGIFTGIIADNAYLFYDMELRRLYPVFVFSSVDFTVSSEVLDISTNKTAFILLDSPNGRGHSQVLFEIVIDKTNSVVPKVLDL